MLSHTDLKKGVKFIYNNQPYEILEASLMFKGRGSSVMQTKIKNLITGNVLSTNFRQADTFEEAEIEKLPLIFIFANRDKYVFSEPNNKAKRIELSGEQVGSAGRFLKPGQTIDGLIFDDKIVSIILPIKVVLKVVEAPPGLRAGRAESGTKQAVLESGAIINVPLFIEQGELIEVNTETGEYVRRAE